MRASRVEALSIQRKALDSALVAARAERDTLAKALRAIRDARDYCAEAGCYPLGLLGKHQEFDDWAADVADKALTKVQL